MKDLAIRLSKIGLFQGLDKGEVHPLGKPAHIVVALDHGRGPAEGNGFDHVGVEGPLG